MWVTWHTVEDEHGFAGREFEVVVKGSVGPDAAEKGSHGVLVIDFERFEGCPTVLARAV
jgi:hypothetical protein